MATFIFGQQGQIVPRQSDEQEKCAECGSTCVRGALGFGVCGDCGAILDDSQVNLVDQRSSVARAAVPKALFDRRPTERLRTEPVASHRRNTDLWVKDENYRRERFARCKAAIVRVSDALQLQSSVHNVAESLALRFVQQEGQLPIKVHRLKLIISAIVFTASVKQGVGVTLAEVAEKANVPRNKLRQAVWKISRCVGVRIVRTEQHLSSLMLRICDNFRLYGQRSAVVAVARKLYSIANDGWIVTGRYWGPVVGACWTIAAESYNYVVHLGSLARFLSVQPGTVDRRMRELKRVILSTMKVLPWGDIVDFKNLHMYIHFVVEYWEDLAAAMPELCRAVKRQASEIAMSDIPSTSAIPNASDADSNHPAKVSRRENAAQDGDSQTDLRAKKNSIC